MDLSRVRAALRTKGAKRAIFGFGLVAALVFSMAWNPPVGTVHKFTESSDYRIDRESGCVNSGDGCHGAEESYDDFNVYHPDAECTTCHDYQGVGCIPCHSPNKNHECVECHDGSMDTAPDRVRLTDPYPKGHYRESTHTALGTDFAQEMRSAESGTATATCGECHSRDLVESHTGVPVAAGSGYDTDIGCGECHNDIPSFGQAEVLADWTNDACEDCHRIGAFTQMHAATIADPVEATGEPGCGQAGPGCHESNDLHALHPDEPRTCAGSAADGEPGCHDLEVEAHKPTATACGGAEPDACHAGYVNDEYSHAEDREVHSPETDAPGSDTSYFGVACGACHLMSPDGTSLVDEHAVGTSRMTEVPGDVCRNCHTHPASIDTVADDWRDRDTVDTCSTCHGNEGLDAEHAGDVSALHGSMPGSEGCASSGSGCHPTSDLFEVGAPTVSENLHSTCLRCHDPRRAGGNMAYQPGLTTCGAARDCHSAAAEYDVGSAVHDGAGGRADGSDPEHHEAGRAQRDALNVDAISGLLEECGSCHDMTLGVEHARPGSSLATGSGTLCVRCHNRNATAAITVKASWPRKATTGACTSCHGRSGIPAPHGAIAGAHEATELDAVGLPSPGACAESGCHASTDLRRVHRTAGCALAGCHSATGEISGTLKACGGVNPFLSCHTGYTAENHFVDHAADLAGTVGGIAYGPGENLGCFGCHFVDLRSEHSTEMVGGSMEGGGVTSCAVCHEDAADPGRGAFASLSRVTAAIAAGDRRCAACHSSGTAADGPSAVASAHKDTSTATTRPAGKVWADPLDSWDAAYAARTGGGHNVSEAAALLGGAKRFPVWEFASGSTTYTWALPPNTGTTTWLKASVFGAGAVATPESISHIDIGCQDCHSFGSDPAGPHGAAVEVRIDPEYSQTGYADPSPNTFQFEATGTDRVICMKCHDMQARRTPLLRPGGNPVHARHVQHTERYPSWIETHYGEKCVDCHVRVPHAWRRPRLLVRTVVTTDGVAPDGFPYVRPVHTGLLGVELRDYTTPDALRAASCATGGCYDGHTRGWHPQPSDVPTMAFWP